MAAYAHCPREPAYSSLDQGGTGPSEAPEVPRHTGNDPPKPHKTSKWEPLDIAAEEPPVHDSTWGEPAFGEASPLSPSAFDPPRGPRSSRQKSSRRPKNKTMSGTVANRESIPPHLRTKSLNMPPQPRNESEHLPGHFGKRTSPAAPATVRALRHGDGNAAGSNLFVANLHRDLTDGDIVCLFNKFGVVENCKILRDQFTNESRGRAFVKMATPEQADTARKGLDGEVHQGRHIKVEKARSSPPRSPAQSRFPSPPVEAPLPRNGRSSTAEHQHAGPSTRTPKASTSICTKDRGMDGPCGTARNGVPLETAANAPPSPPDSCIPHNGRSPVMDTWEEGVADRANHTSKLGNWEPVPVDDQSKNRRPRWPKTSSQNQGKWESAPADGPSKSFDRPRWPKNPPQPRKSHWLKNRDIKEQDEDDESDGGVHVKTGWEDWEEPEFVFTPGQLHDWEGNWIEPSVERDSNFVNDDIVRTIDTWMQQVCNAYGSLTKFGFVPHTAPPYAEHWTDGTEEELNERKRRHKLPEKWAPEEAGVSAEVVSKDWIPKQIEGDSLQEYWRAFPKHEPRAVSDVDLSETTPWWELVSDDHCILPDWDVPDALCDPSEEGSLLPGYLTTAEETVQRKYRVTEARTRKIQERRNRPVPRSTAVSVVQDTTLKPTANIYVRPVLPADVVQITEIYNHYVNHGLCTSEFKERTYDHIASRLSGVVSQNMPWIVAVQKNQTYRRGNQRNMPYVTENIVGFASIDDYCDPGSMYRFTFELEMFVHHEHLHQGIGKCMLDRMMTLVNPGYMPRGGYDWVIRGDYLRNGAGRTVKVVNFSLPHANDQDEKEKKEWVWRFLKDFGFRRAGHAHGLGYKNDKCVDVSMFQTTTTEIINAGQTPVNPL